MAEREIDLLGDAIAGTEKEIFGEAVDRDEMVLDETGDRSVEQMGEGLEGQHEPAAADAEVETDEKSDDAPGKDAADKGTDDANDEADGQPRDSKGKFVDAKSEAKPAATADAPKAGDKLAPDAKAKPDDGKLPRAVATSERERRQSAEGERDQLKVERDTARAEVAAINARFDALMVRLNGTPPQPAKPASDQPNADELPDVFTDPVGYGRKIEERADARVAKAERALTERIVGSSLAAAHEANGEAFEKAYAAMTGLDPQNPQHRATVQSIWNAPNPGRALMNWHGQQEALREVGPDPAKYREKIAAEAREALENDPEFRQSVIDKMNAEARGEKPAPRPSGKPQAQPPARRVPPSLSSVGGSSAQAFDHRNFDGSDRATFESAFADP